MIVASFDVGEQNLAYVIGSIDTIVDMKHIDIKHKKTQTIPESCDMISDLLSNVNWSSCERILIEQQIIKNVRAQRISQHIWTWFRMSYPNIPILYVSSKLKTFGNRDMSYTQRKQWTVKETLKRIKDTNFNQYFTSLSKKDDVADAYLQMIAWLSNYT